MNVDVIQFFDALMGYHLSYLSIYSYMCIFMNATLVDAISITRHI